MMNQAHEVLSNIRYHFQTCLFPWMKEEIGPLSKRQQQLTDVLEVAEIERHILYTGRFGSSGFSVLGPMYWSMYFRNAPHT